jgi:predicted nuclease of restriction endonuclease-like RecB superfamily
LFRALKFHRLLAQIRATEGAAYQLRIQGPMALFQSTQKYGLQLAMFLPSLLLCKQFEAKAQVLWGPQKKPKQFVLRSSDGLRSHLPDFGVYTPPELLQFLVNFREQIGQWAILEEPAPQLLDSSVWVPDFTLRHHRSGATIFVEFVGYWRQVDLESHIERLERRLPGQYLLLVAESHRADEGSSWPTAGGIYRYKRTPIVAEVAKLAGQIAGVI